MSNQCPLCASDAAVFYQKNNRLFYKCPICQGIFLDPGLQLDQQSEKMRYQTHNNDVYDKGYQEFVSPITEAILNGHSLDDRGLDFGAGTGPVISKLLKDRAYQIHQYDPFFYKNLSLLQQKYNYIVCCEVIEHFYHPDAEFKRLKKMLKSKGKLYCMTHMYSCDIEFDTWYYKNDPTHVFIYQKRTLEWIQKKYEFSNVLIEGRLIVFSNE